jgi:ribosomal protein S18 acetylase RimI-like enzyme
MADEPDAMLREMAKHRGFRLVKSRRRKPGGDFGRYGLVDARTGQDCYGIGGDGLEASAEEIESYLRGTAKADWKRSLGTAGKRAAAAKPRAKAAPAAKPNPRPQPEPKQEPPPERAPPRRVIRESTIRDFQAISELLGGEDVRARLKSLIAAGEAPLVAEEDGLVGCAAFHVIPALQHGPIGRILLLVVAAKARRRGVGRNLAAAAEAALAKRGCATIEIAGDIDLDTANAFFRAAGYRRSGFRYIKQTNA